MSTMLAADLARVLHNAMLFASRDDTLPMLNAVQLQATGERLIAAGTDRFSLGVSSAPLESEPFKIMLRLEQAELIGRMAKPGRGGGRKLRSAELSLSPQGKRFTVAFGTGESVSVPTLDATPVKWQQLLTQEFEPIEFIAVNAQYMARFGKVDGGDGRSYMNMWFRSPSKPIRVQVGPDFVGLIMPVRMADDRGWPEWAPKATVYLRT